MTKERLLRLLLLSDGFETAEIWNQVLKDGGKHIDDGEAQDGRRPLLINAIDEVVPCLPDYSTVSVKLKALMRYSETTYSAQVNRLVQGWLQQAHSVPFRRWLLCKWVQCSHFTAMGSVVLLPWRHALFVATMNETVKSLKRTLVRLLSAVDETIGARSVVPATPKTLQSLETVEELLDFCFLHTEQLASYSLLCAAKMHALAVKTQRSAIKLSQEEEVLVRLRWSLMLKPMLFRPLLQHAIALKSLAGTFTTSHLWTSTILTDLVGLVDATSRERLLMEMAAARDKLEAAFVHNAEHIHTAASKSTSTFILEKVVEKYIQSLSDKEKTLLLAELERDLDEAPPHLFPHVFMFLALILGATLSSPAPELQTLTTKSLTILFALFERRTHDVDSFVDVLILVVQLSLPDNPIWLNNARLYVQTIESLVEISTIQVEHKLQWVAKMALHQLLFEGNPRLISHNQSRLVQVLPLRIRRLLIGN